MDYIFSIQDVMDVAAKKVGIDRWQAFQWESVTGGSVVRGEVPSGVYVRGPKKGRPRFGRPGAAHKQRVVVSHAEMESAAKEYEASTGLCWDCKGSGDVSVGWSAEHGVKRATCARCGGDRLSLHGSS